MKKTGTARFIERPRMIGDLICRNPDGQERTYEIVKEIRLAKTDR